MRFDITVRFDGGRRYHTLSVEAAEMAEALRLTSARVPEEILLRADLVELRQGADPESRPA